jgi:UDP-glucose 4-epimerase
MKKSILVTGGAGYIGSHTCIELIEAGYDVIVIDNLINSSKESLKRVEEITGSKFFFYEDDVRNREVLANIFNNHDVSAVIHFAGLKAVGQSCILPLDYYDNNLTSTITLCQEMEKAGVRKLVFSSSATVYGDPSRLPLTEDMPLSATNPYGRSKLIIEDMLRDISSADKINSSNTPWSIVLLRYFNPVGAHTSGLIGEDPQGIPNNLMPYLLKVASGELEKLSIYGNDYKTPDGTGVRDYIHVVDLAQGHVCAANNLLSTSSITGAEAINLGTGNGFSVKEIVCKFEQVNHIKINHEYVARRPGDVAACYANADKARELLNWSASHSIEDMLTDSWTWQNKNPTGYT